MLTGKMFRGPLLALCYLFALEALSWWTALGPGPCLINPEQHAESSRDNQQQACPTFFEGSLVALGRVDQFIEHHDKSIVAVFTMVLAISTIGLWLTTRQLAKGANEQIKIGIEAAKAAQKSAETAEQTLFAAYRPFITIVDIELRDASTFCETPHVNWGMHNSGSGFAVVNRIAATVRTLKQVEGKIKTTKQFTALPWNGGLEVQETSAGHILSTPLITSNFHDIRQGNIWLWIGLELTVQDWFHHVSTQAFRFHYDVRTNTMVRAPAVNWGDEKDEQGSKN